jgi:hypothetical protein
MLARRYRPTPGGPPPEAWKVTAFCMPAGLNIRESATKSATSLARIPRGGTALAFDPAEPMVKDADGNEWFHLAMGHRSRVIKCPPPSARAQSQL